MVSHGKKPSKTGKLLHEHVREPSTQTQISLVLSIKFDLTWPQASKLILEKNQLKLSSYYDFIFKKSAHDPGEARAGLY